MLDRFVDWLYGVLYGRHMARAGACAHAIHHAYTVAAIIGPHAPPALVERYIAACARLERNARRWMMVSTFFGGLVPGFMWAAGIALGALNSWGGTWGIVLAQCIWGVAWFTYGGPRFDFSIVENHMVGAYAALRPLCDSVGQDALARAGVEITREAFNG